MLIGMDILFKHSLR